MLEELFMQNMFHDTKTYRLCDYAVAQEETAEHALIPGYECAPCERRVSWIQQWHF